MSIYDNNTWAQCCRPSDLDVDDGEKDDEEEEEDHGSDVYCTTVLHTYMY